MATKPSLPGHITRSTPFPPAILAWEVYLTDQAKSHYTVRAFSGDLHLLASYLPPDRAVGDVTLNELNGFLNWLESGRGVPCSPKSYARRITSIKAFFRWLHKFGVLIINPAEKIVQKSVISPLPQILSQDEEDKIVKVVTDLRLGSRPDARPFTLLMLLLSSAIKKGECLAINLNHIDLSAPENPILFVRYTNPQSRYKERKIAIDREWVDGYQEYMQQYRPLDQLFPWSPRRLEYLLEDIGKEAGLDKHLSFDMCRWTAAVNDWRAGIDHDKIRQKLGISKIQWREIGEKLNKLAAKT